MFKDDKDAFLWLDTRDWADDQCRLMYARLLKYNRELPTLAKN